MVLYELVTGKVPFPGLTTATIFDGILNNTPAPLTKSNAKAPAELDRIIMKALEKDRDLRYQTAAELRGDLKRLKRDLDSSGRVESAAHSHATGTAAPAIVVPLVAEGTTPEFMVKAFDVYQGYRARI